MDTLYLGTVPAYERCAQTNVTPDYEELQVLECRAYVFALRRKYGPPPARCHLAIMQRDSAFGAFYEVACVFDPEDQRAATYAAQLDDPLIKRWDEVSMKPPVIYARGIPILVSREPRLWLKRTERLETA